MPKTFFKEPIAITIFNPKPGEYAFTDKNGKVHPINRSIIVPNGYCMGEDLKYHEVTGKLNGMATHKEAIVDIEEKKFSEYLQHTRKIYNLIERLNFYKKLEDFQSEVDQEGLRKEIAKQEALAEQCSIELLGETALPLYLLAESEEIGG